MQYFLDSADLTLITESLSGYGLDGVTTNPTILARDLPEGRTLAEQLRLIREAVKGKLLFVQVTSENTAGMVRDARVITEKLGGPLCIKVPATASGIAAICQLTALGISTTATAVYTSSQAMLAAKAGADYVAPYIAHIDNLSLDGAAAASEMAGMLAFHGLKTQVLAASFRTADQVDRVIKGGVSSVTVTAAMLSSLASHIGTGMECESFRKNWDSRFDAGIAELL